MMESAAAASGPPPKSSLGAPARVEPAQRATREGVQQRSERLREGWSPESRESAGGASAGSAPGHAGAERNRRGGPLPLRPRGGFGGYLHELRRERGLTVRQLATAAGVHHTYVSKLERGDRQAPDEAVVEALAAALGATPSQLDQLRWRAGLSPRGSGAPGQDDPTLTLVAEVLADQALPTAERDRLRRSIAEVVQREEAGGPGRAPGPAAGPAWGGEPRGPAPGFPGAPGGGAYPPPSPSPGPGYAPSPSPASAYVPLPSPAPVPDGRATMLAGLLGGWQTLDEAAAELRVTAAYLWELIQAGHLKAWALPAAPAGSPLGVRVRREDVLALLQPVVPVRHPG
jgi:transcriptional regulator with XRE-family HTH domain